MEKLITLVMYALWILTIIAVLATTFTSFQYEDLNAIAFILLIFISINSFFVIKKR